MISINIGLHYTFYQHIGINKFNFFYKFTEFLREIVVLCLNSRYIKLNFVCQIHTVMFMLKIITRCLSSLCFRPTPYMKHLCPVCCTTIVWYP